MIRIIPKNTKIKPTIWKSFTIGDVLYAFACFVFGFILFSANFDYNWVVAVAWLGVSGLGLIDMDGIRLNIELIQMIKFSVQPKKYRYISPEDTKPKGKSVQEITPLKRIEPDGTIVYNAGYFSRAVQIDSIELRLLNEIAQNQKISALDTVLKGLDESQMLSIVKIDRPLNFDDFSAQEFGKIEALKERNLSEHEKKAKLEILQGRINQIDRLNNIALQYRSFHYLVAYDTKRESLADTVESILYAFNSSGIRANALGDVETAVFLKYCYTRNFDEREVGIIAENAKKDGADVGEILADYILPSSVNFNRNYYEIDGVRAYCLAVNDYPIEVGNAWGSDLMNIDNTKVVINIRPVSKDKAVRRVDRAFTELNSRGENIYKASKIMSQQTHIETLGALLQGLQNDNEAFYDINTYVTVFANDDADRKTIKKQTKKFINNMGFRSNELFCRQLDGFLNSNLSMRPNESFFARGISSGALSAVFPFVFVSTIESGGFSLGHNAQPVFVNFWKRNDDYVNSNMMVIGKTGSGKSFFCKSMLTNLFADDAKLFILDPENEYGDFARRLGGRVIDAGSAKEGRLNPLQIMTLLDDDGKGKVAGRASYYTHLQFLEQFFKLTLDGITPDSLEILNNQVLNMYAAKGINENSDFDKLAPEDYPTFDDLYKIAKADMEREENILQKNNLQKIESYLKKFSTGGRNSHLWNGASTLKTDDTVTVFNFQTLLANKNNTTANAQMLLILKYLDNEIIRIRDYNEAHSANLRIVVAIDEAHVFIDPKYPVALDFMQQLAKRIRKYNGMLIVITQNIKDFTGSEEVARKAGAVINACQYSFILALAPQDMSDLVALYRNAGEINEVEQSDIVNNTRGKAFFIHSQTSRTNISVVTAKELRQFFEADPDDEPVADAEQPDEGESA